MSHMLDIKTTKKIYINLIFMMILIRSKSEIQPSPSCTHNIKSHFILTLITQAAAATAVIFIHSSHTRSSLRSLNHFRTHTQKHNMCMMYVWAHMKGKEKRAAYIKMFKMIFWKHERQAATSCYTNTHLNNFLWI